MGNTINMTEAKLEMKDVGVIDLHRCNNCKGETAILDTSGGKIS